MKIKKLFIGFVTLLIFTVLLYIVIELLFYMNSQRSNLAIKDVCYKANANFDMETGDFEDPNGCYSKMLDLLLPDLLVYKVKLKNNIPLDYTVLDRQSLYYVPSFAIERTEALIGYGVGRTCRFEDNYVDMFNKPAYAYDCGNKTNICTKAKFEPQCVGTSRNALTYKDAKNWTHPVVVDDQIHQFGDKLKELGLENKEIILKMNIIGAEDKVINGILEYSENVPVIVMYIHYKNPKMMINKLKTLKALNDKYYLVAKMNVPVNKTIVKLEPPVFSNKYVKGYYSRNLTLTYINKNLVEKAYLPFNQNIEIKYRNLDRLKLNNIQYMNISWVVVAAEKLKQAFGISYE